jgi:alpha-1,2-mannosyltransferase
MATLFLLALIAAIPLVPILGVYIVRLILRIAGDQLRRRTRARRELILQRVKLDEKNLSANSQESPRTEDEDWERVESYAVGAAVKGDVPQEKDYAGVIGFFHPFW